MYTFEYTKSLIMRIEFNVQQDQKVFTVKVARGVDEKTFDAFVTREDISYRTGFIKGADQWYESGQYDFFQQEVLQVIGAEISKHWPVT